MSDGGQHLDNNKVRDLCKEWGTSTHIIPAYSPWINGLVEGTNKILLHVLKRLCVPDLEEDNYNSMRTDDTLKNWPEHLDKAI
jgi:transposase